MTIVASIGTSYGSSARDGGGTGRRLMKKFS